MGQLLVWLIGSCKHLIDGTGIESVTALAASWRGLTTQHGRAMYLPAEVAEPAHTGCRARQTCHRLSSHV